MRRDRLCRTSMNSYRRPLVVLLLAIGVAAWLSVGGAIRNFNEQLPALIFPVVGILALLIPSIRRRAVARLNRIAMIEPRHRCVTAWIIFFISAGYFLLTAYAQKRYFGPIWHDEFSYLTQMQMLAQYRLWMPGHLLGDFFDSFYIITTPVYASMYFPGTALLYLPAVWLGLPVWLLPVFATAGVVALSYRIISELIDGSAGLVAAILLISLQPFRMLSIMVMSQAPTMLLGLLCTWAWLRWRKDHRLRFAILIGIFGGWMAITRPLDALAFGLPLGLAILLDHGTKRLQTFLAIFLAAMPFIVLQLVANRGITGRFTQTPWQFYVDRDLPQTGLGFREFSPLPRPISRTPQKQAFYDLHIRGLLAEHQLTDVPKSWLNRRLPITLAATMPKTALLILLPIGALGCFMRGRWVMAGAAPLFLILYAFSIFYLDYYPVVIAPSVILLVLLGIDTIAKAWPEWRSAQAVLMLSVVLLAAASLPEVDRQVHDQTFAPRVLPIVDKWERSIYSERAVLLFPFGSRHKIDEEPVYNAGVAWPDDARIIRAHDLGPRNREIYSYYARLQSDQLFFVYDEQNDSIRLLGNAKDLAAAASTSGTTRP